MPIYRVFALVVVIFLVTTVVPLSVGESATLEASGQPDITVKVNGELLKTDVPVHVAAGRTLLPVRAVAERVGGNVTWNSETRRVTIARGTAHIALTIDKKQAFNSGREITLDVPAMIINGRTLVPVRFVGENLGAQVGWVQETRSVLIKSSDLSSRPLVFGYYLGRDEPETGLSYQSTLDNYRHLDAVIIASYYMNGDGTLHSSSYDSRALFALAERCNLSLLALVKNTGFSRSGASELLSSEQARTKAVESIMGIMEQGYAGVNLDFENVAPEDRDRYTRFVGEVSAKLRENGYLVTLSVPAKRSDNINHGWSGAFDYKELAPLADYLMVMMYDQHWGNGSTQGPIAGIPWVRDMLEYAVTAIPADKLILGVPGYAYDWQHGTTRAVSMPAHAAVELAAGHRSPILWDETNRTPYFRYQDGHAMHEVHFENGHSTEEKLRLAESYAVRGLALWRLGYEVSAFWHKVAPWRSSH